MGRDALKGEAEPTNNKETRKKLRVLLGLEKNASFESQKELGGKTKHQNRRCVGERKPTRDPVGGESV